VNAGTPEHILTDSTHNSIAYEHILTEGIYIKYIHMNKQYQMVYIPSCKIRQYMVLHMNIGQPIYEETVCISACFKTSTYNSVLFKLATPQLYFTPLLNSAFYHYFQELLLLASLISFQNTKDQWIAVFVRI